MPRRRPSPGQASSKKKSHAMVSLADAPGQLRTNSIDQRRRTATKWGPAPTVQKEATLVDRFLVGDREAFAELVRPHASALYGVALAILKDESDAEETVQDAILKAMTHLRGFRRESRFSTWIMQITINEGRMKLRKSRRHLYRSLDEDTSDGETEYHPRDLADWREIPSESLERGELREALQRALDALSPAAKEVILLRDVQNYSTAETAQMLRISIVAVKSRLLRARMQIRDALAPGIDGAWSLGETKWRKIRPW